MFIIVYENLSSKDKTSNEVLATSGNNNNFVMIDESRIEHLINPKIVKLNEKF